MIPKVIHYCWFGGNPLPELALKCIDSWKKYCPGYEIKEWNERNYDVNACNYVRQAYEAKRWAFVSDYARFDILYRHGGLYFDTDVELIRPIEKIIKQGSFMGCEPLTINDISSDNFMFNMVDDTDIGLMAGSSPSLVAPGLGLAATPGLDLYREILEEYEKADFVQENKTGNYVTVVQRVTRILVKYGFLPMDKVQCVLGVYIYPSEYFCPLNYNTGVLTVTKNTYSIHHYTASWLKPLERAIMKIEQKFSGKGYWRYKTGRIITFPLRAINKFSILGVVGMVQFIRNKFVTGRLSTRNTE